MAHKKLLPELQDHIQKIADRVGNLKVPVHAYLAGGMAVNYHTGTRMSQDVDIQWSHRLAMPPDLQTFEVVDPEDPEEFHVVSMDGGFGDYLGSFHPDWMQDSIEIGRFGDIVLHVISALDLAVSKIGRFTDRDRDDIRDLAEEGLFTPDALEARGKEAIEFYVGDTTFIEYNLRDAVEIARNHDANCEP